MTEMIEGPVVRRNGERLHSASERTWLTSIVVPLHNEEESLEALWQSISAVAVRHRLAFELILVDDGSTDGSRKVIESLAVRDTRVTGVALRRRFGKAAALAMGFKASRGDWIVTMDADLQDDPEEIPALVAKLVEGHDVVSGWKRNRRDPFGRRLASRVFNAATRILGGIRLHDVNCGLKSYTRECALELVDSCYGEQHRYLPVIAHWKGFNVAEMPVSHRSRPHGSSRYGFERYLRALLDLFTTAFLCRYARRPMHLFGSLGLALFVPGAACVGWLVFDKVVLGASIGDRPLLIIGAVMLIAGLQLILTGLLAETVSRTPGLAAKFLRHAEPFPASAIRIQAADGECVVVAAPPHDPAPAAGP